MPPDIANTDIDDLVHAHAQRDPNRKAVSDSALSLTYGELDERTTRLANGLKELGLQRGDRFGILAHNRAQYLEMYTAASRGGFVAVPVDFRDLARVEEVLGDSGARALIYDDPHQDPARGAIDGLGIEGIRVGEDGEYDRFLSASSSTRQPIHANPEDPFVIVYTSGTTGKKKGVVRTRRSHNAFNSINTREFGFTPQDEHLTVLPACHINTVFYALTALASGGGVHVYEGPGFGEEDAERALQIIQDRKITFTSLIPNPHYSNMLEILSRPRGRYDVKSMRKILCSSAPVTREMKEEIMNRFPNADLFEAFGSTEQGLVLLLRPDQQMAHLGSIGQSAIETEVKLLNVEDRELTPLGEVGEIFSRSPMNFADYRNNPEATRLAFTDDGFAAVGDLARMGPDGFYQLSGRKSRMIITGGLHVFPEQVEAVLSGHPNVSLAAVLGLPDERWGEAVTAVIVPRQGTSPTEQDIITYCRESKLAGHEKPKQVIFRSEGYIPRTVSGKVKFAELKTRLLGEGESGEGDSHGLKTHDYTFTY